MRLLVKYKGNFLFMLVCSRKGELGTAATEVMPVEQNLGSFCDLINYRSENEGACTTSNTLPQEGL